jgi:hypothetical protein
MRFVIFPVMGPVLAALVLSAMSGDFSGFVQAISFVYLIGIIPALLTLAIDWLLRKVSWRPLYTGIAGYVMTYTLLLPPLELKSSDTKGLLLFGVGGMVAGAFCSWLSSVISKMLNPEKKNTSRPTG